MDEVLNTTGCIPLHPVDDLYNTSANGYYTRGGRRLAQGRWAEGIADLETAQHLDPDHGFISMSLAIAHRQRGHIHQALQAFERAHQLFTTQHNPDMAAAAQQEISKIREHLAHA